MIEEQISKPRLMFENYPTYLVADTNCFVDHLDGLKAIVGCQAFTLIVPLIGENLAKRLFVEYILLSWSSARLTMREALLICK